MRLKRGVVLSMSIYMEPWNVRVEIDSIEKKNEEKKKL